ncbi:gamma-glutamyl hydrolase A [Capsaspora owczarzaki ATCC 30864]|uniref:folate gamma-glutamyl hydrolase n=1 Tax=Capsaspora owczarzaki (strain ATCC 30864) TaxID=595528 RepID=A0A0D2WWA8_CAPO3|nr:gamma-glutamyl hydrolase A [Capsaspora owczarzaki ATCC 30864]KJE96753.1 gamma-glutamyl hydrolase A [Capsaspora owczarzaki ATCC 30864]|eukprot:XP_004343749.1 gamma-glutamyl hydrolase A [Capsaspora owczarzaki ATCC 30864]
MQLGGGLLWVGIAAILCIAASSVDAATTTRPIIGILAQPGPNTGEQYIAASYVKYVEAAGARVAPIFYNETADNVRTLVASLNGVLFTGGGADISVGTQFYSTALVIYNTILQLNDAGIYMPLWGTCMGFELINNLVSNANVLGSVDAENYTVALDFTPEFAYSRMFGRAQPIIIQNLATKNITMNNHMLSVYVSTFNATAALTSFFNVLSTNYDRQGVHFVSSIEGKKYPVYATQWHPEKNQFEWVNEVIDHSADAIYTMQYMANFLVGEARQNSNRFANAAAESSALIYASARHLYDSGETADASFEETYVW